MAQQVNGVSVGNKVRVSFPNSGLRQDGSTWQIFTYQDSRKNQQTGEYEEKGRYSIFVNNNIPLLQSGDFVTIKSITKVTYEKKIGKDKKESINVNCWCDVEMGAVYQPRLVETQPQSQPQFNTQMETPTFDESLISDDDLPF